MTGEYTCTKEKNKQISEEKSDKNADRKFPSSRQIYSPTLRAGDGIGPKQTRQRKKKKKEKKRKKKKEKSAKTFFRY